MFLKFCAKVESFQIALIVSLQQGVASSRKVIELQRYPVTVVVVYIYVHTVSLDILSVSIGAKISYYATEINYTCATNL